MYDVYVLQSSLCVRISHVHACARIVALCTLLAMLMLTLFFVRFVLGPCELENECVLTCSLVLLLKAKETTQSYNGFQLSQAEGWKQEVPV